MPATGFENYADKVIAYHQYSDALDLTSEEASAHPDTLEAFSEIYQVVQSCPELTTAYRGILDYRGEAWREAASTVREVEWDIAERLHDLGVTDESQYYKEQAALKKNSGVRGRAEQFVALFVPNEDPTNVPMLATTEGLRTGQEPVVVALLNYVDSKGMSELEGRVIAPTGSGKTVMIARFLEQLRIEGRLPTTVIVEPTTHLKDQTRRELIDQGFQGRIQLHESGKRQDPNADVVIITQQGFARQLTSNGTSLNAERTGLVIFDEAHHIGGERTKEAIHRCLPHAGIIGFTASPDYDARRKLANHLPDLISEITVEEAVEWGLISPYQTILLPTHGDLSYAIPSGKDYHQYMLDRALNTLPRNHLVARFLVDNFLANLVVANVNTVQHAEEFAEIMRMYGKNTLAVSGHTKNLDQILEAFRNREITGLVHAKVIGEGVDLVPTEVTANLTPTLSEVREKQRVGRGQRIDPHNPDKVLKVVECVDDNYVKKPLLYGALTGHWLYSDGQHIDEFQPAPGYRVLQSPEEIEAWWNGEVSLPHSDAEELAANAANYVSVEAKIFEPDSAIDLAAERHRRRPRSNSLRKAHQPSLTSEVGDNFGIGEPEEMDLIDVARRLGGGAAVYILDGSASGQVTIQDMKNALRSLAGNPLLDTDKGVMDRYLYIQTIVADHSRPLLAEWP